MTPNIPAELVDPSMVLMHALRFRSAPSAGSQVAYLNGLLAKAGIEVAPNVDVRVEVDTRPDGTSDIRVVVEEHDD